MDIKVSDIIKSCNANLVMGDKEIICENFSKDTREINVNDVYVGIKGENFDGNTLYEQALEKGAKVCILQNIEVSDEVKNKYPDRAILIVEDTIKALQQIAAYKRSLYNIPVIAVTGSVGKTTARDMIASVVATKFKVLKTQGNLNNHIGLPLTILKLKDHEALVVEMGMNHLGEISVLSKIAKPDIAVITNVGTAHLGNLGSREGILKAKLEILDGLNENGILIINNDNDMLNSWLSKQQNKEKIYTFGIDNKSDVMASNIIIGENYNKFEVINEDKTEEVVLHVAGAHFIQHALAAILVGKKLNIPFTNIKEGLENVELTKGRMEIINIKNNITIISDCYNANYDSMKAAIEHLGRIKDRRRIAILGDMLELGEYSQDLHTKVGEEVVKNKIDLLITVGEMGKVISDKAKENGIEVYHFSNNDQALEKIKELIKANDLILVKASNGMKFKYIVDELYKINS